MGERTDTYERFAALVERIEYKPRTGFRFTFKGECVFIQHGQEVRCINSGLSDWQQGRKFYLSPHMTDEEFFRTCYLAVKLFEEHEINETFLLDGERFLNPHPEGPRQ